jgi:hypothetical protein
MVGMTDAQHANKDTSNVNVGVLMTWLVIVLSRYSDYLIQQV